MDALFTLKNLIFTQKQTNYYYYSIYLFLSLFFYQKLVTRVLEILFVF